MKCVKRAAAAVLLVVAWTPAAAQTTAAAAQNAAAPAPVTLAPAQMEEFLLRAKIMNMRAAGAGVTGSRRATLTNGTLTHDAHIQSVNQTRPLFQAPGVAAELNFKDNYRYNVAGYRLAMLLGLDNVPMSVERQVEGKPAAVTWWIDDVMMEEKERLAKEARGPDPERTAMQTHLMRVFDELIANRDRNMGNIVWTRDWKMWLIDHTRAFRLGDDLQKPATLLRIERSLLDNMRTLTEPAMRKAVDRSLTTAEVRAVLARRDVIVKLFEARIAERGEASVLYRLPR
jgi:hypothetical protein